MIYRLLADLVVLVHLAFIVFVAVGALLAWRWPHLVWAHVPVVVWAVAIVAIGFTCPLTPLEKLLRRRAGGEAYDDGFIDHYLDRGRLSRSLHPARPGVRRGVDRRRLRRAARQAPDSRPWQ